MPFDGIFIHHLCNEMQMLTWLRVDKIHQPAREELLLHLRGRGGAHKLLICVNSSRARAGVITRGVENPAQPSALCMLLRKHLTGAVLTEITQPGLERVLRFDFAGTSEIGDATRFALLAEFTGRHGNLIFLKENGRVLGAVRWVEASPGTRPVLPDFPYTPPPEQGKRCLLDGPAAPVPSREPGEIVAAYDGISPAVAREICLRAVPLEAQLQALLQRKPRPWLCRNAEGKPAQFSYFPLTHMGLGEEAESLMGLLELFYNEKDRSERLRQRTAELLKLCENRAARVRRKLEAQRAELAQAEDREALRVCGELILANRAQLERSARGSNAYRLENYYDEGRAMHVAADPALSPAANAQRYFKRYRKAKTAAELLGSLIEQGEAEARYLDSAADLLQRAQSQAEVEALRAELEAQGYVRRKQTKKSPKQKPLPPLEYRSSEGLRILVGRNNVQNDQLSLKTARGGDLWFHVKDYPGSHVILVTEGAPPGEASIGEAAALAAWHSKVRGPAMVDYTPARMLKKPQGAPPGQVIYHKYRSMPGAATEDTIKVLLGGDNNGRS